MSACLLRRFTINQESESATREKILCADFCISPLHVGNRNAVPPAFRSVTQSWQPATACEVLAQHCATALAPAGFFTTSDVKPFFIYSLLFAKYVRLNSNTGFADPVSSSLIPLFCPSRTGVDSESIVTYSRSLRNEAAKDTRLS